MTDDQEEAEAEGCHVRAEANMRAPVVEEQATVYRAAGGRRYFTRTAALRGYAKVKFRAKHPCECDPPEPETGYYYNCGVHEIYDRVMPRYLRWLSRALKGPLPSPPKAEGA